MPGRAGGQKIWKLSRHPINPNNNVHSTHYSQYNSVANTPLFARVVQMLTRKATPIAWHWPVMASAKL